MQLFTLLPGEFESFYTKALLTESGNIRNASINYYGNY
jgi:hypothetical protein